MSKLTEEIDQDWLKKQRDEWRQCQNLHCDEKVFGRGLCEVCRIEEKELIDSVGSGGEKNRI